MLQSYSESVIIECWSYKQSGKYVMFKKIYVPSLPTIFSKLFMKWVDCEDLSGVVTSAQLLVT